MSFSYYMYMAELGLFNRRTWTRVYVQLDENQICITRAPRRTTWLSRWRKQPSRLHLIPLSAMTSITAVDVNEWFLHYGNEWVDLRGDDQATDWIKRLRINYALYHCERIQQQTIGIHSTTAAVEMESTRAISRRASDFVRYWQNYQDYE